MTVRATASVESTARLKGLESQQRVPVGSDVYNELVQTLYDEAACLDERRFDDWAAMLAEDLRYTAPLRITRTGPSRDSDVSRTMQHFNDTRPSIMGRLGRLAGKSAWAEDPPSRTRRFVTNIRVGRREAADEFEVVSYILLIRSRGDDWRTEQMSAERRDVWRRTEAGFQLSCREIIVDQSVLGMSNFAVFF